MNKIIVLQHAECETPGALAVALKAAGCSLNFARAFAGDAVPRLNDARGLVIMGGPMGVYERERYPFLAEEMRLIESALRAERPVLGVCLGSQLLASVLGANVRTSGRKEIGWHEVSLAEAAASDALWQGVDRRFIGLHWHGDIFDLPRDAIHLASSEMTSNQAFRFGRNAYGLLFHAEMTKQMIEGMVATFADELAMARVNGAGILAAADEHLARLQAIARTVFSRWALLCK